MLQRIVWRRESNHDSAKGKPMSHKEGLHKLDVRGNTWSRINQWRKIVFHRCQEGEGEQWPHCQYVIPPPRTTFCTIWLCNFTLIYITSCMERLNLKPIMLSFPMVVTTIVDSNVETIWMCDNYLFSVEGRTFLIDLYPYLSIRYS